MCQRLVLMTVMALLSVIETSISLADSESDIKSGNNTRLQSTTSKFFQLEYIKPDLSFCNAQICVDFDNDGQREILFASRKTKKLQMLNASNGSVIWSKKLAGSQQSISAYDLDGDGKIEILYTVSSPGRLYVLDHTGNVLRKWDSSDFKLGNSAVIVDADGDGQLDGLFGSRSKYLLRLNMADLKLSERRAGWVQCGCHTTAMDVDRDGRWDFFAGSGDDSRGKKGVLHRIDPITLKSLWSYKTNDNASSADPVLVDIDDDGSVEIIKSVDNYARDDAHDAIYAFETDGTLLWKVPDLSGEDSPNVADLDGDGEVEIVGMTFQNEVYCLDAKGRIKWRRNLRPELKHQNSHAYLTPILCDINGDQKMEILALTNGKYFDNTHIFSNKETRANGIVYALSAEGEILDRFDVGGPRYWGDAYVCNLDDDPFLELVITGSGGLDVIETQGFGANTEHFQRRRNYQRLNVVPWAYEDSYFIYRGTKEAVVNLTDNLVLNKQDGKYRSTGKFTTELLTLHPNGRFNKLNYAIRTPNQTSIEVNILNETGKTIRSHVLSGSQLKIDEPVRLEFIFSTTNQSHTPILDSYSLSFNLKEDEIK
ncbi:FG-GAP-like repeat-containing protein [Gimesia aquarii]|uniref:FG-GAP repeat protein n=1 Tax=Gimesia aquarii TaxID=2527964 RepID=A0A517VSF4_9PLAN|nr:FG-GAP-like repeat-containing protein [Gimesia aquarii]QDT95946.1 FG-GAP repeat protein [Gimesia aquarii]